MKRQDITSHSSRLAWSLVVALFVGALFQPLLHGSESPPNLITYKGYLTDSSGTPLDAAAPANHDIIFRIWDASTSGTTIWAEKQTVTVDAGVFSVILGQGSQNQSEPRPDLSDVFAGATASDRYIGLTVDSGTELEPRNRFLPASYAFLATRALEANTLLSGSTIEDGVTVQDSTVTPPGGFPSNYKQILSAQQGANDWNLIVNETDGALVWGDESPGDAEGPAEMSLDKAGNLTLEGGLTIGGDVTTVNVLASGDVNTSDTLVSTGGGLFVDNGTVIPTPSVGAFVPTLKRVYSATQGPYQWHTMMNQANGDLVWANNNADDGHQEMFLTPTGHLNVRTVVNSEGFIAGKTGFTVSDAAFTPPPGNSGTFVGTAKRIYSATRGVYNWHAMINEADGNLLWGDGQAGGGDAHSEMYLTPHGELVLDGSVQSNQGFLVNNPTHTPATRFGPPTPTEWKRILSATIGVNDWNIMMDNIPGQGNLIFADANNGEGPEEWEMVLHRGTGTLVTRGNVSSLSDRRLKKNIEDLGTGVLEKLTALRPVKYNWKRDGDNAPKDFGLIAQEVQELFPEVVSEVGVATGEFGDTLGISYNKMGVLAIGAIKELKERTDQEDLQLRQEITDLKEQNKSLNDQLLEMQSRLRALEKNLL